MSEKHFLELIMEKRKIEQNRRKRAYDWLEKLFKKYNVDFSMDFSVDAWEVFEIKQFVYAMSLVGYRALINYYFKDKMLYIKHVDSILQC